VCAQRTTLPSETQTPVRGSDSARGDAGTPHTRPACAEAPQPRAFELHRPGRCTPFQARDRWHLRELLGVLTVADGWDAQDLDHAVMRLWRGGLVHLDDRTVVLAAGVVR
jgi:hypothetical protein